MNFGSTKSKRDWMIQNSNAKTDAAIEAIIDKYAPVVEVVEPVVASVREDAARRRLGKAMLFAL
jgi:hypothetical protein